MSIVLCVLLLEEKIFVVMLPILGISSGVPAGQFYLVDLVREQSRFAKGQLHPLLDEFTLFS